MLIEVENNIIAANGMQRTTAFQIANSAHAFRILSSGLYSDKIGAVLREIGCNAMDAHIAAGKPDEPFEVHLPSRLINKFYIRDFGLGMSHDDILSLYTTYFSSSKSRSNDFTGAFGLGSKSPFSYTDSFTVTSFHDGLRTTYTAYVGADGAPTISQVSQSPLEADVPTGLMVAMAVKPADMGEFIRKAQDIFQHFRITPRMVNGQPINPVTFESDHGTWAVPKFSREKPYAVMGNVRYFIPSSEFGDNNDFLTHIKPELRFAIGELDVAANREQLEFTPRTRQALKTRVDTIFASFSKAIYDQLSVMKYTTIAEIQTVRQWFRDNPSTSRYAIRALRAHNAPQDLIDAMHGIKDGTVENLAPPDFKGVLKRFNSSYRSAKFNVSEYDFGDASSYYARQRELPDNVFATTAVLIPDGSKYFRDRLSHAFHGGCQYGALYYVSDDAAEAEKFAKACREMPTIKIGDLKLAPDWIAPKDRPRKPRTKRVRELITPYIQVDQGNAKWVHDEDVLEFTAPDLFYITSYVAWGKRKHNILTSNIEDLGSIKKAWAQLQPYIPQAPSKIAVMGRGDLNRWKLPANGWLDFPGWLRSIIKDSSVRARVNTTGVLDASPASSLTGTTFAYDSPLKFVLSHAKADTQFWQEMKRLAPTSPLVVEAQRIMVPSTTQASLIPAEIYNGVLSALYIYDISEIQVKAPVDHSTTMYPCLKDSLSHSFPNELVKRDQTLAAKVVSELIRVDERNLPTSSNIQLAA